MNVRRTHLFKNKIVVLVAFVSISLVLFSTSTGRIFLSDDYCTLYNIIRNDSFLLPSFFRPGGDLTLLWTYQLASFEPFYFYLFNILLHAINSYLLYLFCMKWFAGESRVHLFSLLAGIIFLTYPSHSEAILWAIGRGVSLAVFFSLLAMIFYMSSISHVLKYVLVCLFYFLALCCYESALLLPFVLFALPGASSRKQHLTWTVLLLVTLFFHIYLRVIFTGGVWQAYNGIIFAKDIVQYLSTLVKIILRLFIPPFDHPLIFSIAGIIAVGILFITGYRHRKKFWTDGLFARTVVMSLTGLAATILVSVSFGMSTRTSEGDRLMYMPSLFYAILIALLVVRLFKNVKNAVAAVSALLIFQIIFLLVNQHNWKQASDHAMKVLNRIAAHRDRPVYIINLPSDYKGAYVFRNCLPEALLLYKIDTTDIHIVNVIQSTEIEKKKTVIVPEKRGDNIFIWPNTVLELEGRNVMSISSGNIFKMNVPLDAVLYWNKEDLIQLDN